MAKASSTRPNCVSKKIFPLLIHQSSRHAKIVLKYTKGMFLMTEHL